MKIEAVESLAIPELKVIRFGRFRDSRGYFTESYRLGDLARHPETAFLHEVRFLQINESFSRAGVIRGLHFQWDPHMGKLVRAVRGRVVDLALDIRVGSPTLGRIVARDISEDPDADHGEWIWVPPGFAHGFFSMTDCILEYLCSGEYSPGNEAGISPLSEDIEWSLCERPLKRAFDELTGSGPGNAIMSEKDRNALSLSGWLEDERSADARSANIPYQSQSVAWLFRLLSHSSHGATYMTTGQPSLWSDIRGLVLFGWVVAATRLLLDFVAPEQSMFIGVYFLMPLAYLYYGLKGRWDHLAWRRVALSLVVVVFFVWFIPNLISYSTAFFVGLEHGRFSPANSGRILAYQGPVMTVFNGAMVAGGTFLAGSVWSVALGTLFIWLPGAMRRRQARL